MPTTDLCYPGGSISLSSSDPFSNPLIDPGMLSEDADISVMREAIRSARRLYSAPVFNDFVNATIIPASNITTNIDLDDYIRSQATAYLHSVGSASMSPRGLSWGVVDPDFRVKGVSGLRVVDASVIVSRFVSIAAPLTMMYYSSAIHSEWTHASSSVWVC